MANPPQQLGVQYTGILDNIDSCDILSTVTDENKFDDSVGKSIESILIRGQVRYILLTDYNIQRLAARSEEFQYLPESAHLELSPALCLRRFATILVYCDLIGAFEHVL